MNLAWVIFWLIVIWFIAIATVAYAWSAWRAGVKRLQRDESEGPHGRR